MKIVITITYLVREVWEMFTDEWEGFIVHNMPVKYIELAICQRVLKDKKISYM